MPFKVITYKCNTCKASYKTYDQALKCEDINHRTRSVYSPSRFKPLVTNG